MFPWMAASSLLPSLIGGKQIGSAAPPFNQASGIQSLGGLEEILKGLQQPNAQPVSTSPVADAQQGIVQEQPQESPFGLMKRKLGGFADNLDSNLSSPSKQLGLGLLGQIDPRLGLAGLLAGGIFGGRS